MKKPNPEHGKNKGTVTGKYYGRFKYDHPEADPVGYRTPSFEGEETDVKYIVNAIIPPGLRQSKRVLGDNEEVHSQVISKLAYFLIPYNHRYETIFRNVDILFLRKMAWLWGAYGELRSLHKIGSLEEYWDLTYKWRLCYCIFRKEEIRIVCGWV